MSKCLICNGDTVRESGVHPLQGGQLLMIDCLACGRYYFTRPDAQQAIMGLSDSDRFTLAPLSRRASDAGAPLELRGDSVHEAILAAPRLTLGDRIDRLLLLLADRSADYSLAASLIPSHDFTLVWAFGPPGLTRLLAIAEERNLLKRREGGAVLRPDGWDRVDTLRATQPNSRQAFVAMWFDDRLLEAYNKGLKEGIERSRYYSAVRISAVQHNDKIDDRVIAEIRRSGLVVADFTGQRPNVYYEAGFARGLGITVISTCSEDQKNDLHFDTRQYNHILWNTPEDLARQLDDRISATALPKGWAPPL